MSGIQTLLSNKFVEVPASVMGSLVPNPHAITIPVKGLRKLVFFTLVTLTSALGLWVMFEILRPNGVTVLEIALWSLFSVTFIWISFAFWSSAIGFVLQLFRIDPLKLKKQIKAPLSVKHVSTRTAVVMPVYNEDTRRVTAGFEANLRSLEKTGLLEHFDFYLLSDTQDSELIEAELAAWHDLVARLGSLSEQVYYRRREKNVGRKVGNLAEFCQRWGSLYEQMIVLDADSLMTGECMLSLVAAMEANPSAALVQTVPIPVRQETFFGRFVQYAATLYSPMLATGLAFWQTDSANYWGHNAIIRIAPFTEHCGLPPLTGKGPFSGDILSHDFVEAAMLRRAGWEVILLADLEGSYEEVPSNILDYATRDRRWVQGNIQHLSLLAGGRFNGVNRLHFLLGAVAYISSLLWLCMLFLSSIDAVVRAINSNVFFTSGYQLFPNWAVAKSLLIISLLYLTAGLLLLPKLFGIIVAMVHRRKAFGGAVALSLGALIETIFAIVIAPLMMVYHAYFVVCVFIGRKVSWDAQGREGRMVSWSEAINRSWIATLVAVVWGSVTYYFTPVFFWWMTPVLVGLVLAAPLVRYSSSLQAGQSARQWGIFISPSETADDPLLQGLPGQLQQVKLTHPERQVPSLPADKWRDMPVRSFA